MKRHIHNHEHMSQCVDFSGLEIGKMNATDIDCCMEYKDKLFIYVETKYQDDAIPTGQRLLLERNVDNADRSGRVGIAIKTKHEYKGDIMIADTLVSEYYWRGKWYTPVNDTTLLEARNGLLHKYVPEVAEIL